jgi:hypothetical protein
MNDIFAIAVMPDGRPAPSVLTEAEAIKYLRLDSQKADPARTLQYYRDKKLLKATKIGKNLLYSRKELDRFVETMTNN